VRTWFYYFYLFLLGRGEEARHEAERAIDDNPLSQLLHANLASVLTGLGRDEEARAAHLRTVELDPQFWIGWWRSGLHELVLGRPDEARTAAEKAFAISPQAPHTIGLLAGVMRNAGETARSEGLLQQLGGTAVGLASFYLATGEVDQAVESAGKAIDEGLPIFPSIFVRPFERVLRTSSGWPALLNKLNLES
jgi:tetratricopeptide (TPR) repeat protein